MERPIVREFLEQELNEIIKVESPSLNMKVTCHSLSSVGFYVP